MKLGPAMIDVAGTELAPDELQRDVLERKRRPVEQFEQPVLLVELFERGHRLVGEAAIGLGGEFQQALGRQAGADERLHDALGQRGIGQPGHPGNGLQPDVRPGHRFPAARHQGGRPRSGQRQGARNGIALALPLSRCRAGPLSACRWYGRDDRSGRYRFRSCFRRAFRPALLVAGPAPQGQTAVFAPTPLDPP